MSQRSHLQFALLAAGLVILMSGALVAFMVVEKGQPESAQVSGAVQSAQVIHASGETMPAELPLPTAGAAEADQQELAVARSGEQLPLRAATPWSETATKYRGQNGLQLEFMCPSGGRLHAVWGDHPYTDDSSICSAAVHAGLISVVHGGHVLVQIYPGQKRYKGNHRSGVKSNSYASWHGSYIFPQAPLHLPAEPLPPVPPEQTTWRSNAIRLRGQNGQRLTLECPPFGRAGSVWGSNPYTDDSSICTAAVHAGLLNFDKGGLVQIEIGPGAKKFRGCSKNGVRAGDWGRYDGTFRIVEGKVGCAQVAEKGGQMAVEWSTRSRELHGKVGERFKLICPPGGTKYVVWGSNPYTDDSSICTAAVHAGVITRAQGGKVNMVVREGMKAYQGSKKNGVKTGGWGKWTGSFLVD